MLRDSHMACFGFIRSFSVCFFISFFVLDSLSFSLVFVSSPLPSDVNFTATVPFDPAPAVAQRLPFIFALSLFTGRPFSHTTPRGLSLAVSTSILRSSFSPFAHLSRSLDCHPLPWTRSINTSAQPWRKLGNCGPSISLLFLASDSCVL